MKTILQAVSKFEFDRVCFQKGEASANFGISEFRQESGIKKKNK